MPRQCRAAGQLFVTVDKRANMFVTVVKQAIMFIMVIKQAITQSNPESR